MDPKRFTRRLIALGAAMFSPFGKQTGPTFRGSP